jgi:hypothetical protein
MNTPDPNASAAREFRVQYSGNQPARAGQPANNTYGLAGEGRLIVHAGTLTFEGKRSGFRLGGPPQIALEDVANVDYNAASNGFLIRSKNAKDYIILWASSRGDAEEIWALLPQEKTAEFLAEQEHHDRFANAMTALGTRARVTPAIIAINVAMFIAMLAAGADLMSPSSSLLIRFGSNFRPLTWNGEEWRLLTSAFLHFGLIHIALNMYALYQGGAFVERLFGSTRYALIYLLSALAGSVSQRLVASTRQWSGRLGRDLRCVWCVAVVPRRTSRRYSTRHAQEHRQQYASVLPVFAADWCRTSAHRQRGARWWVVSRHLDWRNARTTLDAGRTCHRTAREARHRGAHHLAAACVDGAAADRGKRQSCGEHAFRAGFRSLRPD